MLWASKPEKPRPQPRDVRVVRQFAVLPTQLSDGRWCWLQMVWKRQVGYMNFDFAWRTVEVWVEERQC